MESVVVRPATPAPRARIDGRAVSIWLLAGAVVLYLAFSGGGYDLVVRNQVGIVVWWVVLVGAAAGLLPIRRLGAPAWAAIVLFGGFVAWTALASTWSQSSGRTLDELSRVACYLGVLVLALGIHRDRERAVRHTVDAVAAAIVVVAVLALLSRLRPGTFSAAQQTATFLPGTQGRLDWPLNYWNALAALMALGLPLLLSIAATARRLAVQAAAAAAIPIVALCGYLTFSRGGALAAAGGLLVYFALTGERIPKLATAAVTAAGSAVLIAGAVHRSAIEDGFANAAARHQGDQLMIAVLLVCAGTALVQSGIGLASRHGTLPRILRVSHQRARLLLAVTVAAAIAVALAASVPSHLSHAWQDFKRPNSASLHQNAIGRFGAGSGNGRYDYWRVSVQQAPKHLLGGSGPGTFQFAWLPRAPYESYVRNAHSLYIETLLEDGIVGLALLVGLFALVLGSAVRLAVRWRYESRARAAAVAAAATAFAISAAVDWVWQVPVLPVVFLLLGAATLAPVQRSADAAPGPERRWQMPALRVALVALSLGCLVAIAIPLASTSALRASQAAVNSGDAAKALGDAMTAARIEPADAAPQLQSALVLELQGRIGPALAAARRATGDEPLNWDNWLVRSRLEAEAGHAQAAIAAYRRARALNPQSPVFAGA